MFLLDQWPCRFVQIVAWVAGVDHKESTMTVTCGYFLSLGTRSELSDSG